MADMNALAERRNILQLEFSRLSQHPARIHRMSETERTERLTEIRQEIDGLERDIQAEAEAQRRAGIARIFGSPVESDPKAVDSLAKLEADAEKALKVAEGTMRGLAAKVHKTQRDLFEARGKAGLYARWDTAISPLANRLAQLAERTTLHGSQD